VSSELSFNSVDAAGEGGAAILSLSPELPTPGDTVKVWISLPPKSAPKSKGQFALIVTEFDSGDAVLTAKFTCEVKVGRCPEVLLDLPDDIEPGYYVLTLLGRRGQEIASEDLIVVDSSSLTKFDLADEALQYTIEAAKARQEDKPNRAILLFEKAAELYYRAESPQCAGLALADAAEVARLANHERFESLGWGAVKFLLLAGDVEGACDVTRALMNSASSTSEAVGLYVETARAALAERLFMSESERAHGQQVILKVAAKSLPPPSGEHILEKMLATMRESQGNRYVTDINELTYLAVSQIALYSRGVLRRSHLGHELHCMTFVTELRKSSPSYAVAAVAISR
jgi:hypothetical protein